MPQYDSRKRRKAFWTLKNLCLRPPNFHPEKAAMLLDMGTRLRPIAHGLVPVFSVPGHCVESLFTTGWDGPGNLYPPRSRYWRGGTPCSRRWTSPQVSRSRRPFCDCPSRLLPLLWRNSRWHIECHRCGRLASQAKLWTLLRVLGLCSYDLRGFLSYFLLAFEARRCDMRPGLGVHPSAEVGQSQGDILLPFPRHAVDTEENLAEETLSRANRLAGGIHHRYKSIPLDWLGVGWSRGCLGGGGGGWRRGWRGLAWSIFP